MLVKFKLNKSLDKKIMQEFLNTCAAGVDFSTNLIKLHPSLKAIKNLNPVQEKAKFISKYVDNFYKVYDTKIRNKLTKIEKEWSKIESTFFEEIRKVFKFRRKINKKYVAYFSIINSCPRWIKSREFCLGYKFPVKGNMETICHEITHFLFYDFISKNFPRRLNYEEKWAFSEIFNVIILNQKQFAKLYYPIQEQGYPAHEKFFKKYQNIYQDEKTIKEFFERAIQLTKNINWHSLT